jgi:predicted nucleic acid-binding protein
VGRPGGQHRVGDLRDGPCRKLILVDTSVWIDHLRTGDADLVALLQDGHVLAHPWVTGELALGHLSQRSEILGLLNRLPQAKAATDQEVLTLIDNRQLCGIEQCCRVRCSNRGAGCRRPRRPIGLR